MKTATILKDNLIEGRPELICDYIGKGPQSIKSHAFFNLGYVYFTNGYIALRQSLAFNEIEEAQELLHEKKIHIASIASMRRASMFEISEKEVVRHGGGLVIPHPILNTTEEDRALVKELVSLFNSPEPDGITAGLGVNFTYFWALATGMAKASDEKPESEQVRLDLKMHGRTPLYEVTAKSITRDEQVGIIMPVQFLEGE